MRPVFFAIFLLCGLFGCKANPPPAATQTAAVSAAEDHVMQLNGMVVRASTLRTADLNEIIAKRYGITRADDALLLLITLRDDAGNAAPADAVQLSVQSAVLPDALKPLAMRALQVDGFTDHIAVVQAKAPATVQFQIEAKRGGGSASQSFTRDLMPR